VKSDPILPEFPPAAINEGKHLLGLQRPRSDLP